MTPSPSPSPRAWTVIDRATRAVLDESREQDTAERAKIDAAIAHGLDPARLLVIPYRNPYAPSSYPWLVTADPAALTDAELLERAAFPYRGPTELEREGRNPCVRSDTTRAAWLDAVTSAPNLDAVIALLEEGPERITAAAWRNGIDPRAWCGWTEHGGHYAFRRVMAARLLGLGRAFQAAAGKARNARRIEVARRFLGWSYQAARNGLVQDPDLREIEILARPYV